MTEEDDFGTAAIVGVGLLGGSIGKALVEEGRCSRVIGVGRSLDRLDDALRFGAVTEVTTELADVAGACDIIILCTPVGQIVRDLPRVLELAGERCTITDVGSIKTAICVAAGDDSRFVGGHPMAGSEQTGVIASRSNLFQEATWALTPSPATHQFHFQRVRGLAQKLDAATLVLTPERHDRAVAVTSHLPHAMATSLMRLTMQRNVEAPEIQRLTAGSFADATRVAASSPELWSDIFDLNRNALIDVIREYRHELDGFLSELTDGDSKALQERFAAGSAGKRSWSKQQ